MTFLRRIPAVTLALLAITIPTAAAVPDSPPADHAAIRLVLGSFQRFAPEARAITYNPSLVPIGAQASVLAVSGPHGTIVSLLPQGLVPNRAYGAHVHTRTCGPSPSDSGPHYQNIPDPHQPSTDPAYANPANEIWLDFTTDPAGNAVAMTKVDWTFTERHAHSVVIHEHHTHTGEGEAGVAGARLACLKVEL